MKLFRRLFSGTIYVLLGLLVWSIIHIAVLRWAPVRHTPLMYLRAWEHRHDSTWHTRCEWAPLSTVSPHLVAAVIASEDNRFEQHYGFDWYEINKAWSGEKRKQPRGASTITQQVAKNVFLLPHRSWLRKGLEAYYTLLIETLWSKRRIMEVYLNVAELGDGIYGVEAAARYYYKKPAEKLTLAEAAMLAACLPNPLRRNPKKPTPYLQRRQQAIITLMRKLPKPDLQ